VIVLPRKSSLAVRDNGTFKLFKLLNKITILLCWGAVFLDAFFIILTNKIGLGIIFAFFTPIRYFLFDIENSKLTKRPPQLDRTIPLTIFINYWNKVYPIPQGDFFADVVGFFLASIRVFINGYALLYFDTFTFFFKVKNDSYGNPLDEENIKLSQNDNMQKIKEMLSEKENEKVTEDIEDIVNNRKHIHHLNKDLDAWTFPIKRYIDKPSSSYFRTQEIGTNLLDDRFMLDLEKYLTDFPEKRKYYYSRKQSKEKSREGNQKDTSY
jgi:hypothetical protein